MQLRYQYRVYPDVGQRRALAQAFGCVRVVKSADLSRLRITQAKRTEERARLADVSAVVLQQALRDLDTAYKNFFDSIKGKRKGPKVAPPRCKSKKDTRQSIRLNTNAFSLQSNGTVYVAKVRDLSRKAEGSNNRAKARIKVARQHAGVADRRYFGRIGRFEPTSQVCSACDTLAAGRADRLNALWSAGKTGTKVPAQCGEAGSHRDGQTTVAGIPALQAGSTSICGQTQGGEQRASSGRANGGGHGVDVAVRDGRWHGDEPVGGAGGVHHAGGRGVLDR
ncbi:helix-turn-helix domain-containing protein [Streptomyces sp. NPDC090045]|uniref:helix-turn-helix domain-containing protein n=1 Tax=Streptomyces sp. NPDC090045 TaxID=3365927 RepID=UPI00381028D6